MRREPSDICFLSEVAAARGATRVAVGHTRNDQAETVLLRLVRGAGPVGLAGIYSRAGQVIRPLLDVRRSDVEAWLRERGETWREDESNEDRTIPRNKGRHELLPWLIDAFGAGVVDVLARQAALSRDDAEWFDMVAAETAALSRHRGWDGSSRSSRGRWGAPSGDCAAGRAGRVAAGRQRAFVGFDQVEAVLALGQAGSGAIDAPGQRIECRQGRLRFEPRPAIRAAKAVGEGVRRCPGTGGPAHRRVPGVQNGRGPSGHRPAPRRRGRGRTQGRDGTPGRCRAEVCRKC